MLIGLIEQPGVEDKVNADLDQALEAAVKSNNAKLFNKLMGLIGKPEVEIDSDFFLKGESYLSNKYALYKIITESKIAIKKYNQKLDDGQQTHLFVKKVLNNIKKDKQTSEQAKKRKKQQKKEKNITIYCREVFKDTSKE
jgi:hypothetical protein